MTPEEIRKLAVEYAEDVTKAVAGDPNLSASNLYGLKCELAEYTEDVIRFILRTHCIVEKSKVMEAYDNANQGDAYDRFENGCNLVVVETLKSLFSPDTFDETDK